jgi:hypothetical protein
MMKVASGGELARFLLALKVVLADRGSAPTLVFDEIDTGVGGAVADAIGVRLRALARRVQVITVTHAPQVAARAERHYLITKDALEKGKRVATRVTELAADSAARRSRACWPAPRSRPRRAPPPRSLFARRGRLRRRRMSTRRLSMSASSAGTPTTRCSTKSASSCRKAGHRITRTRIARRSPRRPIRWLAIDVLLCVAVFPLTRAILAAAPRLRAIISAVTGVDGSTSRPPPSRRW